MMSKSPVDIHINDQNGQAEEEEEQQPEAYALPPLPVPVRPTSSLSPVPPTNLGVASNDDDPVPKLPSRVPSPVPPCNQLYANLPVPTPSTQELYSTPPSPVPVKEQQETQAAKQQNPEETFGASYAIPPTPVPAVAQQDRKCSLGQSKPKDSLEKCLDGTDTVMIKIVESSIPKTRCYQILDRNGRKIFDARKDTDGQGAFGTNRSFTVKFTDGSCNHVFQLSRPFSLFPQFSQSIQAEGPNGIVVGTAKQHWSFGRTQTFTIIDAIGRVMLRIEGPCGDVGFIIYSKDKSVKLGKISTNWTGLDRETFTDNNQDYFGISFPGNLSAKIKAVLLGACTLLEPIILMNKPKNK